MESARIQKARTNQDLIALKHSFTAVPTSSFPAHDQLKACFILHQRLLKIHWWNNPSNWDRERRNKYIAVVFVDFRALQIFRGGKTSFAAPSWGILCQEKILAGVGQKTHWESIFPKRNQLSRVHNIVRWALGSRFNHVERTWLDHSSV